MLRSARRTVKSRARPLIPISILLTPDANGTIGTAMARIRAVSLDFYNTLVRFEPRREQIQTSVCAEFGITVDANAILRAYPAADQFLSEENGALPLSRRTAEQTRELWGRYEMLLLAGAGVTVDLDTASRIFDRVYEARQGFAVFPDVVPALAALQERGFAIGVVTNFEGGLAETLLDLGIARYLSFAVTSEEVGVAKPNAPIFEEALVRAGVSADQAVHVGDQPYSDVQGALGAGVMPILIDRDGAFKDYQDARVISSLEELPDIIDSINAEWTS